MPRATSEREFTDGGICVIYFVTWRRKPARSEQNQYTFMDLDLWVETAVTQLFPW